MRHARFFELSTRLSSQVVGCASCFVLLLFLTCTPPGSVVAFRFTPAHQTKFGQSTSKQLKTVDGRRFDVKLVSIDEAWNLRLETNDRQFVMSAAEVLAWGDAQDVSGGPIILLTDGSWIVAEITAIERDSIRIYSRDWRPASIPIGCVRGIAMQPSADPRIRDRTLNELMRQDLRRDRVVLRNGDVLEGMLVPTTEEEAEKSTIRGISSIGLQVGAQSLVIPRDRIASIHCNRVSQQPVDSEASRGKIGFHDGSLFECERILEQRDHLDFFLACGITLSTSDRNRQSNAWQRIATVQPRNERVVYLSDREVAQYEFHSEWGKRWEYQIDANVLGGKLRSSKGIVFKGIGMHSDASLAYYLDGKFRRLQGDIALDRSAGVDGSVIFRVYATDDGREWELAYESPIVRGGDDPIPIDVDVADALAITLAVGYADRGNTLDRANWLQLHLTK